MRPGFIGFSGRLIGVLTTAILVLLAVAPFAQAISEAEKSFLSLYFSEAELHVISATRSLQSIARVAENIEVVTADDIELMNAHTLADVLNTVNGVKVNFTGRFGAVAIVHVQGSEFSQVTVLLDGVPLSNVSDNMTEVGFFPVTDIERIEIVKGPASSAWGSALGGVINVITKGPGSKPIQGNASLDYGTKRSADYRAAVSGRLGGLGYYLSGTGLRTDGLTDGYDVHTGSLGAKLDYALSERTTVAFNLAYGSGPRGEGNYPEYDLAWDRDTRQTVSKLSLRSAVGSNGHLDLSLWSVAAKEDYFLRLLSDGQEQARSTVEWNRTGAGLSYTRSHGAHDLVVGADYSVGEIETSDLPGLSPDVTQWALYANDTIMLGALSVTPGIRYDDISISDGFVSPSLGATYALSRNTLLRATVARGFSVPSPIDTNAGTSELLGYRGNPDLEVEKIWSYQAGIEANLLDSLWLKVAAFRHDVDDAFVRIDLDDGFQTDVNQGRQRRQGLEFAIKTVPYRHCTLAASAEFMEAEDRDTHEDVTGVPKQQFNVGLKYDDEQSFRALLSGNYRKEDYDPAYDADLGGFIFDLNLTKRFAVTMSTSLEAFFSVHNLFNGDQYYADIYKNPERWVEGGVRFSF